MIGWVLLGVCFADVLIVWCACALGARVDRERAELFARLTRNALVTASTLSTVRGQHPRLSEAQVYAVAQARARLAVMGSTRDPES